MTNRVSTNHLLEANGLGGGCYGFPTSGNLCIPSNAVCTPYTVRQTDTCGAIARANDISPVQLMSWNLQLGGMSRPIPPPFPFLRGCLSIS